NSPSAMPVRNIWATESAKSRWSRTSWSRTGPGWSSNSAEAETNRHSEPPSMIVCSQCSNSARSLECGPHDLLAEQVAGPFKHLQLERFLGLEVREQPALGQLEPGRERADGQAGQAETR